MNNDRHMYRVYDKNHRWCKKCRAKAFEDAVAEANGKSSPPTPDERRIRRVLPYGDYHAWLALYRAVVTGREIKTVYATKTSVRIDRTFRVGRA